MSKLDQNQRVTTSKGGNAFDLGHDYLFTATTGQLRPVSHDLLQPGDKVKCKFDFFVRSMPMQTAAIVDVDFFVDYYFVPMPLLWLAFDAWWSQTNSYPFKDNYSDTPYTGAKYPTPDEMPVADLSQIFELINATDQKWQDLRLCDDLGLSGMFLNDDSAFNTITIPEGGGSYQYGYPKVMPWAAAAYQAIYQHFYRDEEREEFDSTTYVLTSTDYIPTYRGLFKMRYLNRQDDYFTASKLSPLVANINNNPDFLGNFDLGLGFNSFISDRLLDGPLSYNSNSSINNLINDGFTGDGIDHGSAPGSISNTSRSVNQLRALFAQEKLLHVMNMTSKNYDSQVLARLGFKVPNDVKHEVQHLGHEVCTLDIQEIVSGSDTFDGSSGAALGALAGQGKAITRNFNGVRNFTAPCHGVLMTIFTCRTRPKYTVSALRKDMIAGITDFFTPELDDLGMQPLYNYETKLTNTWRGSDRRTNPFTIIGWNYRYEYLKRNINRSSIAFMRGSDGSNPSPEISGYVPGYNTYSQWSNTRIPLDYAYKVSSIGTNQPEDDYYTRPHVDIYKVLPNELDNIMLINWLPKPPVDDDGQAIEDWVNNPWLSFQRDPFIIDGHFTCTKISKMSVYSMPKLV